MRGRPIHPDLWAWAEAEYVKPDADVRAIAKRLGRTKWTIYTHMAARGLHRKRGGGNAAQLAARRQRRTRKEQQAAWVAAKRARDRRAEARRDSSPQSRAARWMGERDRRERPGGRFRCACGALSTSADCPNGHRINPWIAA